MKTKHTPTPWSYQNPDSKDGGWIMTDARVWGRQVTGMFYGEKSERIANGNLIVTAVNNHAGLIAALKSCRDSIRRAYSDGGLSDDQRWKLVNSAAKKADALLTKLKGNQ